MALENYSKATDLFNQTLTAVGYYVNNTNIGPTT